MPGFIDEVIDYTLANAPYLEPVLAFCGAVTLHAALAGRRVRDPQDKPHRDPSPGRGHPPHRHGQGLPAPHRKAHHPPILIFEAGWLIESKRLTADYAATVALLVSLHGPQALRRVTQRAR